MDDKHKLSGRFTGKEVPEHIYLKDSNEATVVLSQKHLERESVKLIKKITSEKP